MVNSIENKNLEPLDRLVVFNDISRAITTHAGSETFIELGEK
jgi:hypothetical protein